MSDEIMKGAFSIGHGDLTKLLNWASAPLDSEKYDQAYFNLSSNGLRTIANAGESLAAYCTFETPFVQNIEHHDSVDPESGMEAVVKIPHFQQYLNFVGGNKVNVEFYGNEGERGTTKMVLDGDLTAQVFIPSSKSDYESKQLGVVKLYDDENRWVKTSTGEPLSTSFTTTVEEFNRIISVSDFDSIALTNYPVVIKDGQFLLDAMDDNARNSISGSLYAEEVEGPDVNNTYSRGFEELFSSISGKVDVMIEQDHPISITYTNNDGSMTLRYSILPAV